MPQTLTEALHEFVEKDNKESMKEAIHRVLQETQVGGPQIACAGWASMMVAECAPSAARCAVRVRQMQAQVCGCTLVGGALLLGSCLRAPHVPAA